MWIQILNCDYSRFTFLLLIKSLFHNYLFKTDQTSQRRFEPLYQIFRRNSFGFLNLFSICLWWKLCKSGKKLDSCVNHKAYSLCGNCSCCDSYKSCDELGINVFYCQRDNIHNYVNLITSKFYLTCSWLHKGFHVYWSGGPTQRTKFQMCQIVTSLGMRE